MATSHQTHNDGARDAIQAILHELPEDHPAREAYRAGADPIRLIDVVEREDLAEKLKQAWEDWYTRRLLRQRQGSAA